VEKIEEEASRHNLRVIYDAAHAFGVMHRGRSLLSYGDASILSFHATKIFHTIEGGAIVFRKKEQADRARLMINFGISDYDKIDSLGINAKMNEFQAAMGLCLLDDMGEIIASRKLIWERYLSAFEELAPISLQWHNPFCSYNYTYFPVLLSSESEMLKCRDALTESGISPRRYFYPSLNTLNYITELTSCPVSESISSRILCLPIYQGLDSGVQEKIIAIVTETASR
jgi:dTDP-4-amino-4,6-dideoxygalactose transaminase